MSPRSSKRHATFCGWSPSTPVPTGKYKDLDCDTVIVALGTHAAHALLKIDTPISRLRGQVLDFRGAKLVPTFHPAYLLRSPDRKRDVWEDMKRVRDLLRAE